MQMVQFGAGGGGGEGGEDIHTAGLVKVKVVGENRLSQAGTSCTGISVALL